MATGGGSKVRGVCGAYGYWGTSPWQRVEDENIPGKVIAQNQDKLITRGVPVWLYLPVTSGDACSCVKQASLSADRPCPECYGTGFVPGFTRFLTETLYAVASLAGTYTLTGCAPDFTHKPNPILLNANATSGTIVTTDEPYSNTSSADWETSIDSYIRAAGNNTVTAEFSTDAGATYHALSAINGGSKPVGTGTLRFRITMTRTSTTVKSPAFHAVRARHVRVPDYNATQLTRIRGNLAVGQILVLRPWVVEQSQTDTGRGNLVDWTGDRSWTMPLSFFDLSITPDTATARIDDQEAGPHPFFEYASGIKTGNRSIITSVKWNEEFGAFTQQDFDERRMQDGETPYRLVW